MLVSRVDGSRCDVFLGLCSVVRSVWKWTQVARLSMLEN